MAAELGKAVGLPSIRLTVVSILTAAPLLAATMISVAGRTSSDEALLPVEVIVGAVRSLQLGFAALGVLIATSEHTGHQLRTTMLAVPRRSFSVGAKAVTQAVLAGAVAAPTVSAIVAVAVAAGVSPRREMLRAAIQAAIYLIAVASLGTAVGLVARSTVTGVGFTLSWLIAAEMLAGSLDTQVMPFVVPQQVIVGSALQPICGHCVELWVIPAIGWLVATMVALRRPA